MKKIIGIIILTAISIFAFCVIFFSNGLLRFSKERIHAQLISVTPLGSDKLAVLNKIKDQGFKIEQAIEEAYQEEHCETRIGSNYIRVHLGEYQGIPFRCDVMALWVFDEHDKLVHIKVWKEYDGL